MQSFKKLILAKLYSILQQAATWHIVWEKADIRHQK
jgi:hypothetical protein